MGFNRLGDLDTSACGSNGLGRRRAVADPTRLSPVGCSFVFVVHVFIRNPGPEGRHSIQGHSMYFAVELCILLRNYMYAAAELNFHIVEGGGVADLELVHDLEGDLLLS